MQVVVTDVVRDEGSVVILQALTTDGSDRVITFACDHRPAQEIVAALESGEDALCSVELWQILSSREMPRLSDVAGEYDPDFDYDNVIKVAKEMWGDPYGPDGEYKPEMITAAIAEIERRKQPDVG